MTHSTRLPTFASANKSLIFCPETPWDIQWNRKQEENECKLTKHSTDRLYWNFEHVAYTWWWFSFYLCMLIHMSHNRGLVFRGTHYTKSPLITPTALTLIIHATKQQKKKKKKKEIQSVSFGWILISSILIIICCMTDKSTAHAAVVEISAQILE